MIISYYLADGTIQVSEPREENSGLLQGLFLKRHKVPNPAGGFYSVNDFACGKNISLYSKTVRLISADAFTRRFYTESGSDIGEDMPLPCDPFAQAKLAEIANENRPLPAEVIRAKILVEVMCGGQPLNRKYKQYLESEGKVLRFKCIWQDDSVGGERHWYDMHYFLSDDTIELIETRERTRSCAAERVLFMKRRLVPRSGDLSPQTSDSPEPVLQWSDLHTDTTICIGNRLLRIVNCDPFTKQWYLTEHGLELAEVVLPQPLIPEYVQPIPPSIGFGSEEDSLNSCKPKLVPKSVHPHRLAEYEGVCLRFTAVESTGTRREFKDRNFVVAYYPIDSSVGVWEEPVRNSGIVGGKFAERSRIAGIKMEDFQVGNAISVSCVSFKLTGTDLFTANWLQSH